VGRHDEALELCDKLEETPLRSKIVELKAAIFYEKNDFQGAMKSIKQLGNGGETDVQLIVNEGCIYFKLE
jgi:hypothetical protein